MYMQYLIVELKYANRQHGCFKFPYWLPHVPPPLSLCPHTVSHPPCGALQVGGHVSRQAGGGLWVLFLEDPPLGSHLSDSGVELICAIIFVCRMQSREQH